MAIKGNPKNTQDNNTKLPVKPVLKNGPPAEKNGKAKTTKRKVKKAIHTSQVIPKEPTTSDAQRGAPQALRNPQKTQKEDKVNDLGDKPQEQHPSDATAEQLGVRSAARKEQNKRTVLMVGVPREWDNQLLRTKFPTAEEIRPIMVTGRGIRFPSVAEAEAVANQKEIDINGHTLKVQMLAVSSPPPMEAGYVGKEKRSVYLSPIPAGLAVDRIQERFPDAQSITLTASNRGCVVVLPTVEQMEAILKEAWITIADHKIRVKRSGAGTKRPALSEQTEKDQPKAKRPKKDSTTTS